MAHYLNTHTSRTQRGPGQYSALVTAHRQAYIDPSGNLQTIHEEWVDDAQWEHAVILNPFIVGVGPNHTRTIHPNRDPEKFISIGSPYINPGGGWQQVNLPPATRHDNRLSWVTSQADIHLINIGKSLKLAVELKDGWRPPNNRFAFPVGLTGLQRDGNKIMDGDDILMTVTRPVVWDLDNEEDIRTIDHSFISVSGQTYSLFQLPDLAGMTRPWIDPTLDLQPDDAGEDTRIKEAQTTRNYGASTDINVGNQAGGATQQNRGLMKLDISALPSGIVINSATLTLRCLAEDAADDEDVSVHRGVSVWYEGVEAGAVPDTEEGSTWAERDGWGSEAWTGGAGGVAGTEYRATATDTTTITGAGAFFNWNVKDDVERYYSGASNNRGWWIINDDEVNANTQKQFVSSDGANPTFRPQLVIEYDFLPMGSSTGLASAIGIGLS